MDEETLEIKEQGQERQINVGVDSEFEYLGDFIDRKERDMVCMGGDPTLLGGAPKRLGIGEELLPRLHILSDLGLGEEMKSEVRDQVNHPDLYAPDLSQEAPVTDGLLRPLSRKEKNA